jgi:primase-polymerase (primpol)-like protein
MPIEVTGRTQTELAMTDIPPEPQTHNGDLHHLPAALIPFTAERRWVLWKWEWRKGRWTKPPLQVSGAKAKSNDPATWSTYVEVIEAFERGDYDGIGYALFDSDIAAFDLDDCYNPETGLIHPWVKELIVRAGSYYEVTPSGEGLRIIGHSTGPALQREQKVDDQMGECASYRRTKRYITITGNVLPDAPQVLADIDAVMDTVVAELDALNNRQSEADDDSASDGTESDAELPASLVGLLYIPNLGASEPHAGYETRSHLAFAFFTMALRARASAETIIAACLDQAYRGCATEGDEQPF